MIRSTHSPNDPTARPSGARRGSSTTGCVSSTPARPRELYPGKTAAQLWGMIGVTEDLGVDDFGAAETFTLADARAVQQWAAGLLRRGGRPGRVDGAGKPVERPRTRRMRRGRLCRPDATALSSTQAGSRSDDAVAGYHYGKYDRER
jgi:hypothetical protein